MEKSNVRAIAHAIGAEPRARRPRDLHPARDDPGAALLPAGRPALRDADRRARPISACGTGATASQRLEATTPSEGPDAADRLARAGPRVVLVEPITWTWAAGWRPGRRSCGSAPRSGHRRSRTTRAGGRPVQPGTFTPPRPNPVQATLLVKTRLTGQRQREARRRVPRVGSSSSPPAHPLRQLARRSPARARSRSRRSSALPRWKRSKMCSRSSGGHARAAVGDAHRRRACRRAARADLDRLAGAARSAARCRSGSARTRAQARRVGAAPSTGRGRVDARARRRARRRAARTRPPRRARSRPARPAPSAAGTAASSRERSSSSLGQRGQPPQLARGRSRPAPGRPRGRRPSRRSSSSSSIVPWSIVSGVRSSCEAVETNERRAASWRRSSSCMRPSARARSPTSSRPAVASAAGASGPSGGDPQRGALQAPEPARERAREREPERRSPPRGRSPPR